MQMYITETEKNSSQRRQMKSSCLVRYDGTEKQDREYQETIRCGALGSAGIGIPYPQTVADGAAGVPAAA